MRVKTFARACGGAAKRLLVLYALFSATMAATQALGGATLRRHVETQLLLVVVFAVTTVLLVLSDRE